MKKITLAVPDNLTEGRFIQTLIEMDKNLKKSFNKHPQFGGMSANYEDLCSWLYNHPEALNIKIKPRLKNY